MSVLILRRCWNRERTKQLLAGLSESGEHFGHTGEQNIARPEHAFVIINMNQPILFFFFIWSTTERRRFPGSPSQSKSTLSHLATDHQQQEARQGSVRAFIQMKAGNKAYESTS